MFKVASKIQLAQEFALVVVLLTWIYNPQEVGALS